jgi:hypothetical protein
MSYRSPIFLQDLKQLPDSISAAVIGAWVNAGAAGKTRHLTISILFAVDRYPIMMCKLSRKLEGTLNSQSFLGPQGIDAGTWQLRNISFLKDHRGVELTKTLDDVITKMIVLSSSAKLVGYHPYLTYYSNNVPTSYFDNVPPMALDLDRPGHYLPSPFFQTYGQTTFHCEIVLPIINVHCVGIGSQLELDVSVPINKWIPPIERLIYNINYVTHISGKMVSLSDTGVNKANDDADDADLMLFRFDYVLDSVLPSFLLS